MSHLATVLLGEHPLLDVFFCFIYGDRCLVHPLSGCPIGVWLVLYHQFCLSSMDTPGDSRSWIKYLGLWHPHQRLRLYSRFVALTQLSHDHCGPWGCDPPAGRAPFLSVCLPPYLTTFQMKIKLHLPAEESVSKYSQVVTFLKT